MEELELGQATIVYEDPDEGTVEETVANEQLLYARDHWMIKAGTDDQGNDLMRQIPATRVYHVRRNVERFEEQAQTVRKRVESVARGLGQKLPMDVGGGGGGGRRRRNGPPRKEEAERIPVEESDDESGE